MMAQRKSLGDKTCHLDVFSLLLYADMYSSVSSRGMWPSQHVVYPRMWYQWFMVGAEESLVQTSEPSLEICRSIYAT